MYTLKKYSGALACAVFALCLILSALTVTCQTEPAVGEAPGEQIETQPQIRERNDYAEARPEVRQRDELVIAFSKGELELDFRKSYMASEAQIFTAIYEGLFSYNPLTMEPVLAAASRWETSEDKKQWTFTIRENARFQNGDPLRAEDFRAAWLSLLEPEKDSPYSSLFDIIAGARDYRLGKQGPEQVGISCPTEKTLVVRLNSPASFFPSMLCHHSFSPIHPSLVKQEVWKKPISNGPFYIEEIDDDHILLVKNNSYWDARQVDLNRLVIRFTSDGEEAAAMWNSGEARWIHGDVNY